LQEFFCCSINMIYLRKINAKYMNIHGRLMADRFRKIKPIEPVESSRFEKERRPDQKQEQTPQQSSRPQENILQELRSLQENQFNPAEAQRVTAIREQLGLATEQTPAVSNEAAAPGFSPEALRQENLEYMQEAETIVDAAPPTFEGLIDEPPTLVQSNETQQQYNSRRRPPRRAPRQRPERGIRA